MSGEETLSRTEMMIEQEKLKLERERMLLERERLEAVRDRVNTEKNFRVDGSGKQVVAITSVIFISIICLLTGGILGAFSTSFQINRSRTERVREVMQSLSSVNPDMTMTNQFANSTNMPAWLKAMKPKESHSGISLVVIQ
ncbi:MAG: hypothetical protein PF904_10430 [Kiritimatiellae bacterium]|jgi:hypothetical protein|nr:hypothetical protein [Kiritimatiellia bacterium]